MLHSIGFILLVFVVAFIVQSIYDAIKHPADVFSFYHLDGINFLSKDERIDARIVLNKLEFFKNQKVFKTIHLKDISNIVVLQEIECTEENKSVINRALVGGLLLGPIGAVVGGASGIGTNRKEKTLFYIEISTATEKVILRPILNNERMANSIKNKIYSKI